MENILCLNFWGESCAGRYLRKPWLGYISQSGQECRFIERAAGWPDCQIDILSVSTVGVDTNICYPVAFKISSAIFQAKANVGL